jgi:hypothetical protein
MRPIISNEPEPVFEEEITNVELLASRERRQGLPSLRVDYIFGFQIVASEWICSSTRLRATQG